MKPAKLLNILLTALVALLPLATPQIAHAVGTLGQTGTVKVTINAPSGVPGDVLLNDTNQYVATKAPSGTSTTDALTVVVGSYKVNPEPVTINGHYYTATASSPQVPVLPGQVRNLTVNYAAADTAYDLHASDIEANSVSLTWTVPAGYQVFVNRSTTANPATAPGQGIHLPVSGSTATDTGLSPGTPYTYSFFTLHNNKWVGPQVLHISTTNAGSNQASYVLNPQTLLLKSGDITSAAPNGLGVSLTLANNVLPPVIGSAVIVPILPTVPGGYLGIVTSVSADGHSIMLQAGGLSDAFDFYNVSIPNFSATTSASDAASNSNTLSSVSTSAMPMVQSVKLASAGGLGSCIGGSGSGTVAFSPSLELSGHFNATIEKYSFFGLNVPTGATLDLGAQAKVTGAASVEASGTFNCGIPVPPVLITLTASPIPISFYFSPTAQFSIGGALKISNIGFTATGGFNASAHFGLTSGASFNASPIVSASPLTPTVTANGEVGMKVGGQVIVGPGAGTPDAGVIAGVGGELDPVDAGIGPVFQANSSSFNACVKAHADMAANLSLTAKAWMGNWDVSQNFQLLNGTLDYPGSPWYIPNDCENTQPNPLPTQISTTAIGGGVTENTDSTAGDPSQFGHLPGFAPGQSAWVLSTGHVADAVGVPSDFASTDLGEPGDDLLSALSGEPTYDAASYTVNVTPTGNYLHVKYVFASEEYPEFVGSQFNDVMAVLVNGTNCAYVPGTNTPVAINTINDHTNSQYYVDNTNGAAGYSTSMDGLTVPLTCTVPVTPGVPVTVKIAVADSSDHIYDSAVALLDQGIWSDNSN